MADNNDDLKIVVGTELEADEQASAERISAQLPNIAKLINSKSAIKVGVVLDGANIQAQSQKIAQQITRVTKTQGIDVQLNLDQSSVNKIRTELNSLKVDPDVSSAITEQLDRMGIQIDRISGRWETVNGQEEKMLNLTIQGTDQMQRTVTYLQTYDTETGEINTQLTNVTANLERQRKIQEQIAAEAKRDNESRNAFLTKQKSLLDDLNASYTGSTSAKPILDETHLDTLNNKVKEISDAITALSSESGKLTVDQRANISSQIDGLKRLVKEYQNAEYVATKLRTKDIGTIKIDQQSNLEALEKRLQSAGILTDQFKTKISELKKSLQAVGNKDQLVGFLNSFDNLNNEVSVFQERLRGANHIYQELISLESKITSVQSSIISLDPQKDSGRLSGLQDELYLLTEQRSALESQLAPYADIVQYVQQAKTLEEARLLNEARLNQKQGELADSARAITANMSQMSAAVRNVEQSFSVLNGPTQELSERVSQLQVLMEAVNRAASAQDKIAAYNGLKEEIAACKNEIGQMQASERKSLMDDKTIINMERANVILDSLAQKFSFIQQDADLSAKLNQLRDGIESVKNAGDFSRWTTQLSEFRAEITLVQERINAANNILNQMLQAEKKITGVQAAIIEDTSSDEAKQAALDAQLETYIAQKEQLSEQLLEYSDILQYTDQISVSEAARLNREETIGKSMQKMADKAREYDNNMRTVQTTVADLETKYKQIVHPTETLSQNMNELRETAASYNSEMSDQEKIKTYERMQQLIGSCNKEMAELFRIQRSDTNDFKFTQNLEKAKADLATVERTWSAFRSDPGLNAQFQQLTQNLKLVNNQMDLNKWTSQFSAFKSEVKAAGKNMQSLGDVLKNNVGKVLQWVSATTLLFRAFNLFRSAWSVIVDLDTAMIDLQKVTTATREEYDAFYHSANDTAKALGVTTEEVISQTAEWARLGYAMEDAASLAKNSAIFEAISPDMDITQATDGLVSIIKAYDIDVEDSLDGIISKVNDIGNKFAVSNGDIVEAMTRTSSAMAAANNTFEETVALATSAIEITRDAASVGNGLKTLSMRIRGYDEETEEFSGDVAELTGAIADLTKVASNNYRGVSLFEAGDPDTYRSTYDILSDIADIWDELTDKNRSSLMETLFGKRQAQIGSAILTNFDQARKAIETMENSAGSAEREMSKVEESLEFKLNALQETWVGVAQNLFRQDDMKIVVEMLTALSNIVDVLTGKLGLLGSVVLVSVTSGFLRFYSTMQSMNSAVAPVIQTLSGTSFDGSSASALQYASALSQLDVVQQKAAMSALGLSNEQQSQILTMMTAIEATRQYSVAELEKMLNMEAGTISNQLNVASTDAVTASLLKAAVANGVLTEAELQDIVAKTTQIAESATLTASNMTLADSAKAAAAAMMSTPTGWLTILISLLPVAIAGATKLYDILVETAEEATEKMEASVSKFQEAKTKVDSLNDELATTKERIEELESKGHLTFVEESELQKLREANESLKIQADLAEKERQRAARDAAEDTVHAYRKNFDSEISQSMVDEYIDRSNNSGNNASLFFDETDISALLAGIQQMEKLRDACDESSDDYTHFQTVIKETTDNIWEQAEVLSTYKSNLEAIPYDELSQDQKEALDEINGAIQLIYQNLDPAKWNEMQWDKIAGSDEYKDDVQELQKIAAETGVTVDTIRNQFPALAQACTTAGLSMDGVVENLNALADAQNAGKDTAETYTAKLSELPDVLAKLKDSYDVAATAEAEMATGGLSPETIKALADAEENYLSYLYEENGVVKLNTEAWRENANAKMESEKGEIEKEIESLKKRNQEIENSLPSVREYIDLMNEVESLDIDQSKTVFGNIDTNNRQVLEWTEENLKLYEDALKSWDTSVEEMRGTISTVFGGSSEYDGIEIAFSPMLQTENGAVLLDRDTVDRYIFGLIESAGEDWTAQDLLRLDTSGLEIDGITIKNLLADIGDTAIQTGEAMHFVGANGAIASMKQYLQEAGAAAGFTETEITNLTEEFISNASAIESDNELLSIYSALLDEISSKSAFSPTFLEQFSAVEKNIKSLTDVLSDFEDGTAASASTLNDLYQTFGDLDSFEQFIKVTANAKSSMEEVQDAANALAEEYINSIGILDNLTESNASVIESLLEEMGVTNAHEVVMARLNATRLEAVLAANGMADAVWEDAEALLEESGAADNTIQYLKLLRQEQYNAQISAINFKNATSDVIAALAQQAAMAGVTADKMAALQKAQSLITRKESGALDEYEANNYGDILDRYLKQAQADIGSIDVKVPEIKVSVPRGSSSGKSGSSSASKASKEVEEYIADVDAYREAVRQLEEVQERRASLEDKISKSSNYKEQIALQRELINAYKEEQAALHTLNDQRDVTIAAGVQSLRELGFAVEYNCDTNELWIDNLEHLNELQAESKGKYDSVQEATNALRKDTEELIGTITDLNDANQENSDSWHEIKDAIRDAKVAIVSDLKEIVNEANDALDSIQGAYDTLTNAATEYAENGGFLTIDTYQQILALGTEYMQYLMDENGMLVLNKEKIEEVVAAKTQQLAIEQALTYIERLRLALQEDSIEDLNQLLFATEQATDATWGLVYANLSLLKSSLNDAQYEAALHNIQALQGLANTAVAGIGHTAGEAQEAMEAMADQMRDMADEMDRLADEMDDQADALEDMADGMGDLLKYVMDMLKQRIEDQIDALEDMKDAYSDIIDLKKKSLRADKDAADYQKNISDKVKDLAALQSKADALSLDDSREAQAERSKLLEEIADLQEDLADTQADHAIEVQEDALDKMEEAYHEEKDKEIEVLEESISSYQKLYDMAIDYIRDHWDTLYQELLDWNYEYGTVASTEITAAWEDALAAAQRYGDYLTALAQIQKDIDAYRAQSDAYREQGDAYRDQASSMTSSSSSWSSSYTSGGQSGQSSQSQTVGQNGTYTEPTDQEMIHAIISEMYRNAQAWKGAGDNRPYLENRNLELGAMLKQYGINAERKLDGVWYVGNEELFKKYKQYLYHTGGIVGGGSLKENEQLAILKDKEWVLSEQMVANLKTQMERIKSLSEVALDLPNSVGGSIVSGVLDRIKGRVGNVTTNNENDSVKITIGDTIIQGSASSETVQKHAKVTYDMVNQIARILKISI